MEFPLPLRTAIEQKAQDSSTAELIREAQGSLSAIEKKADRANAWSPPTARRLFTRLCGCPLPLAR